MNSNEAYKKMEGVVKDIDPTAKELAKLTIEVVNRNYLEHSMVHFYDEVINTLQLKVAQIKYKNLKNQ